MSSTHIDTYIVTYYTGVPLAVKRQQQQQSLRRIVSFGMWHVMCSMHTYTYVLRSSPAICTYVSMYKPQREREKKKANDRKTWWISWGA